MNRIGFFLLLLVSSRVFSSGLGGPAIDKLSHDIVREKQELSGRWESGETWKGFLCQGEYSYTAGLRGKLDDLKMKVAGEGAIDLRAEIVDLAGDAYGSYRASQLLCIPFYLGVRFFIDRVTVTAKAALVEEGSGADIKVRITSTRFGQIHFAHSLSPSLETFVTRLVNSAFRWLWDSNLGVYLSERISKEINKDTD